VPRGDRVLPAEDGAAEGPDFSGAGLVLQITAEPLDEGEGELGVVVVMRLRTTSFACQAVRTSPRGSPASSIKPGSRCGMCSWPQAADPRPMTIYERRRQNIDRHAAYVVVPFVAGG